MYLTYSKKSIRFYWTKAVPAILVVCAVFIIAVWRFISGQWPDLKIFLPLLGIVSLLPCYAANPVKISEPK